MRARNFQNDPRWVVGVVVERHGPLSYSIQLPSGQLWKRHIDHLYEVGNPLLENEDIAETDVVREREETSLVPPRLEQQHTAEAEGPLDTQHEAEGPLDTNQTPQLPRTQSAHEKKSHTQ